MRQAWTRRRLHGHATWFAPGSLESLRHVGQTDVLIAFALGHDAIVEGYVGTSAALFVDLKTLRCFVAYIETFGIALRGQEYVILYPGIYGLREGGIELDAR